MSLVTSDIPVFQLAFDYPQAEEFTELLQELGLGDVSDLSLAELSNVGDRLLKYLDDLRWTELMKDLTNASIVELSLLHKPKYLADLQGDVFNDD